jgi:hypothetical protein
MNVFYKKMATFGFLALILMLKVQCFAQADSLINEVPTNDLNAVPVSISDTDYKTGLWILGFGGIVLLCEMFLVSFLKFDSDNAIKLITITLVITGLLFMTTLSLAGDAIAPAIGLLGTIVGYLMGKYQSQAEKQNS